jgi:LysR family transcriptional activator of nhaA
VLQAGMYNYNHLYYFYTTVKSGGVTSAAKHLLISQPSLSSQLKVLEEFLQIKLFKKVGRKNKLTPEGALVFGFCRQMFELAEEMHESIIERMPYASRRIYIGVSDEIANSFVVEVISHFLKKYNGKLRPKVVMVSGKHERLAEQLRFREIDVVVTSMAMTHPDIENLKKVEVPVNLICPHNKNFPKVSKSPNIETALKILDKNQINQWVMPAQGTKLRSETNDFFDNNSLKGRIVFESDVMESLTRSVVDKTGIAFLPLIYVPQELEHKSLYSFGPKKGYWKYRIWLASHNKNQDDHLIKSLAESFKDVCTPLISR